MDRNNADYLENRKKYPNLYKLACTLVEMSDSKETTQALLKLLAGSKDLRESFKENQ